MHARSLLIRGASFSKSHPHTLTTDTVELYTAMAHIVPPALCGFFTESTARKEDLPGLYTLWRVSQKAWVEYLTVRVRSVGKNGIGKGRAEGP